jgi:ABC-type polysaccharide/polyol phosphate export permease
MKTLSQFLPLTHAVSISRAAFSGEYPPSIPLNVAVVVGLGTIAFVAGIRMMKKRLIK